MKHLLILLISAILVASGCSDLIVTESDIPDMSGDIAASWKVVHDVYPFLQMKRINWDSVHAVYEPRAEQARGDEILPILIEMLSGLGDGHVSLVLRSGIQLATYRVPRSLRDAALFDPLVVRRYFGQDLTVSSDQKMEYGVLTGNIGYIRLTTFVDGSWVSEFTPALEYLWDSHGLIIDIRHNGGGSTNVADKVISRFIDSPLACPQIYQAGQLQPTLYVQPRGPRYTGNVVVLTNGVCFSSAEYFAEMMKQIPTAVTIGDTTGGGGGIPERFALRSGIAAWIPRREIRRHDGVPIEWNGIPPTTRVVNTAADLNRGKDNQLEYAIQSLRTY